MKKAFRKYGLLVLILFTMSLGYQYHKVLFLKPQSIHQWRQADCLSITKNYEESLNFFQAEIHNFISDGESSGKTAGEFPALYYFMGVLWSVFGESTALYRLFVLLLFFVGLAALYDLSRMLIKNNFWAYFIVILVFTSPVLVYYANNFLTNVPAISLVFIGWRYLFIYFKKQKTRQLIFAVLAFSLAALLKMTAAISIISLFGILLFETIGIRVDTKKTLFPKRIKAFGIFLFGFLLIFLWYWYAEYYNNLHGGKYTFNWIWPLWKMSSDEIDRVLYFGKKIIINQSFYKYILMVIAAMAVYLMYNYKRNLRLFNLLLPIISIGVLLYVLLWFNAFDEHDYYIINLQLLPIFIITGFFTYLSKNKKEILQSKKIKIIATCFLGLNFLYAANNISYRYGSELTHKLKPGKAFMNEFELGHWSYLGFNNAFKDLKGMRDYLKETEVEKDDLIIFLPDESFNISLYLLDQKGWTGFQVHNKTDIWQKIKEKNVQYLFLGNEQIINEAYLKPFLKYPIGKYKEISIYDISKLKNEKTIHSYSRL